MEKPEGFIASSVKSTGTNFSGKNSGY